jgi:hypothetical protein
MGDSADEVEATSVVLALPVAVASDGGDRIAAGWSRRLPASWRAQTTGPSAAAGVLAGDAVAKEDSAASVAKEAAAASIVWGVVVAFSGKKLLLLLCLSLHPLLLRLTCALWRGGSTSPPVPVGE